MGFEPGLHTTVKIEGATYYKLDSIPVFRIKITPTKSWMGPPIEHRDFKADISKNTVKNLKLICKYLGIKGYSTMLKEDLISSILSTHGRKQQKPQKTQKTQKKKPEKCFVAERLMRRYNSL